MIGGRAGDLINRGSDIIGARFQDQTPEWRKEHENAFAAAQEEVKDQFHKCPSCGLMVCHDCWNEEEGLCIGCAPREAAYVAKARNEAMRRNIDEAAENAKVWNGKLEKRITICPKCGKPSGDGKFCGSCGARLDSGKCPSCRADVPEGNKFCGECGEKL